MASQPGVRDRIEAVRIPWYRWQTPALQIAAVVIVVVAFFLPSSVAHAVWWRATGLLAFAVLLIVNGQTRERAWRQLIAAEAPDLHRKLNEKQA